MGESSHSGTGFLSNEDTRNETPISARLYWVYLVFLSFLSFIVLIQLWMWRIRAWMKWTARKVLHVCLQCIFAVKLLFSLHFTFVWWDICKVNAWSYRGVVFLYHDCVIYLDHFYSSNTNVTSACADMVCGARRGKETWFEVMPCF